MSKRRKKRQKPVPPAAKESKVVTASDHRGIRRTIADGELHKRIGSTQVGLWP